MAAVATLALTAFFAAREVGRMVQALDEEAQQIYAVPWWDFRLFPWGGRASLMEYLGFADGIPGTV